MAAGPAASQVEPCRRIRRRTGRASITPQIEGRRCGEIEATLAAISSVGIDGDQLRLIALARRIKSKTPNAAAVLREAEEEEES